MAKYRLRAGMEHHEWRDGVLTRLTAGDVVELSEAQAKAFADKFEPSPGAEVVPEEPPGTAPGSPPQPPGAAPGQPPEPSPWDEILSLNAPEVIEWVEGVDSVAELTALGDAESAGKNRKGVHAAIVERIKALEDGDEG